jgi:hypothetical protein
MAVRMTQLEERLLGMTDHAIGEARLIVLYKRDAIFPRNIPGRDDHEFFPIDS